MLKKHPVLGAFLMAKRGSWLKRKNRQWYSTLQMSVGGAQKGPGAGTIDGVATFLGIRYPKRAQWRDILKKMSHRRMR